MVGCHGRRTFLARGSAALGASLLLKACGSGPTPTQSAGSTESTSAEPRELEPIKFTLD